MTSKFSFAALLLALVSLFSVSAKADTIYTYSGNTFDRATGSITGSFDVASPLGDNWNMKQIDPLSFSFTNNLGLTLSNLSADPHYTTIDISTNSIGKIVGWSISLYSYSGQELYTSDNSSWSDDFTTAPGYRTRTGDPGSWTVKNSTATPEPSSSLLLFMGLGALAFSARRRVFATN